MPARVQRGSTAVRRAAGRHFSESDWAGSGQGHSVRCLRGWAPLPYRAHYVRQCPISSTPQYGRAHIGSMRSRRQSSPCPLNSRMTPPATCSGLPKEEQKQCRQSQPDRDGPQQTCAAPWRGWSSQIPRWFPRPGLRSPGTGCPGLGSCSPAAHFQISHPINAMQACVRSFPAPATRLIGLAGGAAAEPHTAYG